MPFGSFIEKGKADITENTNLSKGMFKDQYYSRLVSIVHEADASRNLQQHVLPTISNFIRQNTLKPPQPSTVQAFADKKKGKKGLAACAKWLP